MNLEYGYIFTNFMTLVGVLSGWIYPIIGLMIYHGFALLRPTYLWFWAWDSPWTAPRYSFYVALSTLVGWFFSGFGKWSGLRSIKWPLIGMGLYVGWGFVLAKSNLSINGEYAMRYLDPQAKIFLMMLVSVSLIRSAPTIKAFAWMITFTMGYLAYNFNVQYLDNNTYLWLHGFGGVDNNGAAMMMVCAVPIAFFMGIWERRWWIKLLCVAALLFLTHTVLFSYSRGGQLGLCLVGAAIFFVAVTQMPHKIITIALAVIATWITLDLAGPLVRERFMSIFVDPSERDASAASRFDTWRAAWACMKDHPLGVGPRNFNLISQNYGLPVNKSVHNLFLQTGADYGWPGLIGLVMFYGGTMVQAFRLTRHRIAKRMIWPRYFGMMVVISIGGFMVCSTFIGMESVETAFVISLLGLCTVAHVDRVMVAEALGRQQVLPELEDVPSPEQPHPGFFPA